MSFKRFLNSHFVFGNEKHISFFQGSSFRFAVIKLHIRKASLQAVLLEKKPFSFLVRRCLADVRS